LIARSTNTEEGGVVCVWGGGGGGGGGGDGGGYIIKESNEFTGYFPFPLAVSAGGTATGLVGTRSASPLAV
jgi:hypothetical protein